MIAVHIEKISMIHIVIYRSPAVEMAEFDPILEELKSILERMEIPNPTVVLSGDFNFPSVEWTREPSNGCRWKLKDGVGVRNAEVRQFMKMNEIADRYSLVQIIEEHTRDKNTLDLVYTNKVGMISHTDVLKSAMSDHLRMS